VTELRLRLNLN